MLFDITRGDGPPGFADLTDQIVGAVRAGAGVLFVTRAASSLSVIELDVGVLGRTRYARTDWLPNDGIFQRIPGRLSATSCGWWSRDSGLWNSTPAGFGRWL
jgi:hypothetical protein